LGVTNNNNNYRPTYTNKSLPAVGSTVGAFDSPVGSGGAGGAAVDKNKIHLLEVDYSNRLNYIAFTLQIKKNHINNNFYLFVYFKQHSRDYLQLFDISLAISRKSQIFPSLAD